MNPRSFLGMLVSTLVGLNVFPRHETPINRDSAFFNRLQQRRDRKKAAKKARKANRNR